MHTCRFRRHNLEQKKLITLSSIRNYRGGYYEKSVAWRLAPKTAIIIPCNLQDNLLPDNVCFSQFRTLVLGTGAQQDRNVNHLNLIGNVKKLSENCDQEFLEA